MHLNEKKYHELKLISLLKNGSEYAFQLIYDHYRNRVYKQAQTYLKSPSLAQEALQDVFLKLWFSRENLHSDTSLEPWLMTVTKNHLLNQLKTIAHEWIKVADEKLLEGIGYNDVENDLKLKEYKSHFNKAVDRLSEKQREVFLLAREGGLSYQQIAEKLNTSPLTVKTHMARALAAIKSYFKESKLVCVFGFF